MQIEGVMSMPNGLHTFTHEVLLSSSAKQPLQQHNRSLFVVTIAAYEKIIDAHTNIFF
jgi:hypothetical protein